MSGAARKVKNLRVPESWDDLILELAKNCLVKYNKYEYKGTRYIEIIVGQVEKFRSLDQKHVSNILQKRGFSLQDIWAQGDIVFMSFVKEVLE